VPPNAATVDHIIPKSNPKGTNSYHNLVTACRVCNTLLGAKFSTIRDKVEYIHSTRNIVPYTDWGDVTIKAISIDPGKTTGVVMSTLPHFEDVVAMQVTNTTTLLTLIEEFKPDVVIIEQFVLRRSAALQLSGSKMYSAEVIGAVQIKCSMLNIPIVEHHAYQKDTISDHVLKYLGLYQLTVGKPHARDAARHLARYCWDIKTEDINAILKKKVGAYGN